MHRLRRELPQALALCSRAIELDPAYAFGWYQRAAIHHDMGDKARALSDLNRAVELEPDNTTFRHLRGIWLMQRKDYRAAIADFDRIIAVDPDATAYMFRGASQFYLGNYDAAIADAEHAINLDPNHPYSRQVLREAQAAKARSQRR